MGIYSSDWLYSIMTIVINRLKNNNVKDDIRYLQTNYVFVFY